MLVRVDRQLDKLLSLGLGQPPSQGLQSRANLDFFLGVKHEVLNVLVVEGCELLLQKKLLAWLLVLRLLHLVVRLRSGADSTIGLLRVEPVLELPLKRLYLLLEGVVVVSWTPVHELLVRSALRTTLRNTHAHQVLLLERLDERRLAHVDTVLPLNFISIVDQECLVPLQLLLNWLDWHLIDRLSHLHGFHCEQKLLSDVEDVSREQSPLTL